MTMTIDFDETSWHGYVSFGRLMGHGIIYVLNNYQSHLRQFKNKKTDINRKTEVKLFRKKYIYIPIKCFFFDIFYNFFIIW